MWQEVTQQQPMMFLARTAAAWAGGTRARIWKKCLAIGGWKLNANLPLGVWGRTMHSHPPLSFSNTKNFIARGKNHGDHLVYLDSCLLTPAMCHFGIWDPGGYKHEWDKRMTPNKFITWLNVFLPSKAWDKIKKHPWSLCSQSHSCNPQSHGDTLYWL